jgi:hypothetical protein
MWRAKNVVLKELALKISKQTTYDAFEAAEKAKPRSMLRGSYVLPYFQYSETGG